MKAIIEYSGQFTIPKNLPHRGPRVDEDSTGWPEFSQDEVGVLGNCLVLSSNCGSTTFMDWVTKDDHYVIPVTGRAKYDGARRAFNAVSGIKFPECIVTNVESTLGRFQTLEDYDEARKLSLPVMKIVERFLYATHSLNPRAEGQARMWLMKFEEALRPVIDMDDPSRNPIHYDGSKGYLA